VPSAGARVVGVPAERLSGYSKARTNVRKLRELLPSGTVSEATFTPTMSDESEDPTTEELRIEQGERETASHKAADRADTGAEEKAHERRAEKSAYLREKLEERERAERKPRDE